MYRWLEVWPCDVRHFSFVNEKRVRTHPQTPSLSQSFFTCSFTSFLQPSQRTIPRSHRRSCHDASYEIDYNKHHNWHGKWEPLRLTATWISTSWCVCVWNEGCHYEENEVPLKSTDCCQFSYRVVVFVFTVYDDGQITNMFNLFSVKWKCGQMCNNCAD